MSHCEWKPIEEFDSEEPCFTWHDYGDIVKRIGHPNYGKRGYSLVQRRFGGRLFPSEAIETGFVTHWMPLPPPPEE